MTEHKLLKYLSKTFELPVDDKRLTPVVLTDSKGKYLYDTVEIHLRIALHGGP